MRTEVIPISAGGWNASMPLDMMPPTDAVRLINLIPDERSLNFRGGSTRTTVKAAVGAEIETMTTHRDEDGTETLVFAADNDIKTIDISDGTVSDLGTGFTNDRWQTVNFNNLLLMVNGADTPQQYDGTTLQNYVAAISGATATDLKGVTVFKGRCYYWENNAAKFWYPAAGAYGGALTSFPLDLTTKKGGYVMEICTWTRDSGDGVDDLFVVIMSTGETLVYQGSSPADFALIGNFNLGEPVGIRGSTQFASDRIIVTKDGFVNLSTALQVARVSEKNNVSSKIIDEAKRATRLWGNNFGWEIFYHDNQSLLMVNVPRQISSTPANSKYEQYCMNTNTGAWTRFKGWNAISFTEIGSELYMGCSDGHIRKCFDGANDDGVAIDYTWIPAFTSCQMPGRKKQATFLTLHTNFTNKENIGVAGLADYEERAFGNAAVPDLASGDIGEWDVSDWDDAYWDGTIINGRAINKYDFPIISSGYTITFKINIQSDVQTAAIYAARVKYKAMRTI